MSFDDDPHLDVCQNIETGIKHIYDEMPAMTDAICVFALEQGKIAIKQQFGYALNEPLSRAPELQALVAWFTTVGQERIGKVNELTLKEYVARLEKIRKSVARHAGVGERSYYEFIRKFIP